MLKKQPKLPEPKESLFQARVPDDILSHVNDIRRDQGLTWQGLIKKMFVEFIKQNSTGKHK